MARPEHDIIIVGGGPAGLSLGLHLLHRRPGLRSRVVVLEKEHYPREKFCAGGLGARGEMALHRVGVSVEVPSAEVSGISVKLPQGTAVARRGAIGRVVRRVEFDHALARAAAGRGLSIVEGARVLSVERGPGGVVVQTSQGEVRGRVVVGADGVGSAVRRSMGLGAGLWRAQVLEVDTPATDHDPAPDLLHFDLSDPSLTGYFWDFPTIVGGERVACRGVYRLIPPGEKGTDVDLEARLSAYLARAGLDLAGRKKKRFAERGFAPHEPASAPRALLIGEAAGVDPITGEGIAQALLYGEAAAPYLIERLEANRLLLDDWAAALRRTSLGLDMRIRHEICARFFGPARPFFEKAFLGTPDALPLGVDYFAGRRLDRVRQLVAGVDVARHAFELRALRPWQPWLPAAG